MGNIKQEIQTGVIYHESNLDTMARMPDGLIDMIITSPPYNVNLRVSGNGHTRRSRNETNTAYNKYEHFSDDLTMGEYFNFHKLSIEEMLRVCSGYVFWNIQFLTGNKKAVFDLIGHFSANIKEVIIWDKTMSEPAMRDGCLNSGFEVIIVFCGDKNDAMRRRFDSANFERGGLENILRQGKNVGGHSSHGAGFPEYIPRWIIKNFGSPGAIVYDPFLGTGTTAVAAITEGCEWIGSEIEKEYVDISAKRINLHKSQSRLF